jgi:hypothetical protein
VLNSDGRHILLCIKVKGVRSLSAAELGWEQVPEVQVGEDLLHDVTIQALNAAEHS